MFTTTDAIPRKTKRIIETLYKSIISDFLPTYLTPNGKEIMTPAIYEKTRKKTRKTNLSIPVKIVIYGIKGIVVIKHKDRDDIFPKIILSFLTGICLSIHMVFSSFKNRFNAGNTPVYITTT